MNLRVFVLAFETFAIDTGTFVAMGPSGRVEDLSVTVGVAVGCLTPGHASPASLGWATALRASSVLVLLTLGELDSGAGP